MGHRKTPSLHIRFDGFQTLDRIESWANSQGEKIVPWARQALINQAQKESTRKIICEAADVGAMQSLALLREMVGPEASQRAYDAVKKEVDQVKNDVAKKFR